MENNEEKTGKTIENNKEEKMEEKKGPKFYRKQKSELEVIRKTAEQAFLELPEHYAKELKEAVKGINATPLLVFTSEESWTDYVLLSQRDNGTFTTHTFTYDPKHGVESSLNTGHYDIPNQIQAENDAVNRVLDNINTSTLLVENTNYTTENTTIKLKDDTTYDPRRLSDKDFFAAAWQERNMPFLKNEYTDTYKKEFPELVKMRLMPDVSFIAETMKKHPEYTDFNNKYIREGIDIMRTPDERLNPYTKFTKHIMEYAYAQKKLEDDNFKIYNDLAKKNIAEQLSAKEAELDKREAEVKKEMERLKKAQEQTQNILSNFNKIIKKEGEFNIDLPYMFRGLSKEQTQDVWKTLGKICDQKRSENAAKENNENTNKKTDEKDDEKDGSNTGSKR